MSVSGLFAQSQGLIRPYNFHLLINSNLPPVAWGDSMENVPLYCKFRETLSNSPWLHDRNIRIDVFYSGITEGQEEKIAQTSRMTIAELVHARESLTDSVFAFPSSAVFAGVQESEVKEVLEASSDPTLQELRALSGKWGGRIQALENMSNLVYISGRSNDDRETEEIAEKIGDFALRESLPVQVFSCGASFGDTKFANNLTVYPQGDNYGKVTVDNVEEIIAEVLGRKPRYTLGRHWRGRILLDRATNLRIGYDMLDDTDSFM